MPENGLVMMRAAQEAKATADRLAATIVAAGMTVFARIDHAAGAVAAGLSLRPLEVLIFGNAKGGTPLMQAQPTIGIDLPLKMLVWEDEQGHAWLGYNDPHFLARRHGLGADADPIVNNLSAALKKLAAGLAAA